MGRKHMPERTILVVDDHEPSRELIEAYLAPEGYRVVMVGSGEEALECFAEVSPDLVLLDILMPHTNGFAVCEAMKQTEQGGATPVVMLTSLKDRKDRQKSIEAGADDFLTKPVNKLELLMRIRSLIRIRRLHVDLEQSDQKLHRAESGQHFLLQMIVHDLKNPLTVVETNLEMMEMKGLQDVDQNLAASRHYCRILYHMIQDLSETARLEEGTLNLHLKAFDFAELVNRCAAEFQEAAAVREKVLRLGITDPMPAIGDSQLLYRVVFNLIANALGRAQKGGHVCVRLAREGDGCLLSVGDDGQPIAELDIARAFDKYGYPGSDYQVGKGLSLAFCRMAVEAHGGSISVGSDLSEGTRFTVLLPDLGEQMSPGTETAGS